MPSKPQTEPGVEPTDAELVATYRESRSENAFAELVVRYQVRLFRVLLGMVRRTDLAEELCQRSFVKAALRIDQLHDPQAFYGWLLAIARSTALDELRRAKHRRHETLDEVPEQGQSPNLAIKHTVHEVLDQLSPEDRMVLVMADMQELAMKEVAEALGVKLSAAKMRVKRARDRFRQLYEDAT